MSLHYIKAFNFQSKRNVSVYAYTQVMRDLILIKIFALQERSLDCFLAKYYTAK